MDKGGLSNAHHTAFPEASFDAVILYGVVPAPFISEQRLSQELYRLLKPGGIVAVWTLAFWSPQTLMQAAPFTLCAQQQRVHRLQKPLSE
jgi:demethylmenaquinone methyltransferase/2-methoxy-6-polyprenyl-1,4-benzoquinol methylase